MSQPTSPFRYQQADYEGHVEAQLRECGVFWQPPAGRLIADYGRASEAAHPK